MLLYVGSDDGLDSWLSGCLTLLTAVDGLTTNTDDDKKKRQQINKAGLVKYWTAATVGWRWSGAAELFVVGRAALSASGRTAYGDTGINTGSSNSSVSWSC